MSLNATAGLGSGRLDGLPWGVTPVKISWLYSDHRHRILLAYQQDGIMLARVFQGSTDTAIFEDFIKQLLHYCSRWPEPKSVRILDNASFQHSTRIEKLYKKTRVKLLYQPPCLPDLNPIKEFFTELDI